MLDGGWRDVGAGHPGGVGCEERAAVAFAARDVEHVAARDERRHEMIAMPVLVPDLAGGAGDEALAGEREGFVHAGNSTRLRRAAAPCGRTRGRRIIW